MLIESACPEDLPKVAALAASLGLSLGETALLEPTLSRTYLAKSEDGQVIGFLHALHVADELQIQDLGVAGAWQRQGVGQALLRTALGRAENEGARLAILEVRAGNRPAVSLYTAAGFECVRRRNAYYASGEDALEMQRVLESSTGRTTEEARS